MLLLGPCFWSGSKHRNFLCKARSFLRNKKQFFILTRMVEAGQPPAITGVDESQAEHLHTFLGVKCHSHEQDRNVLSVSF